MPQPQRVSLLSAANPLSRTVNRARIGLSDPFLSSVFYLSKELLNKTLERKTQKSFRSDPSLGLLAFHGRRASATLLTQLREIKALHNYISLRRVSGTTICRFGIVFKVLSATFNEDAAARILRLPLETGGLEVMSLSGY